MGLDGDVGLVSDIGGGEDMGCGAVDGGHEFLDFVGIVGYECVVGWEGGLEEMVRVELYR